MRHYVLTHRTTCTYPEPVTSSYGRAHLLPRGLNEQAVHHSRLTVTPSPAEERTHVDPAGNRTTYFHITEEHTTLAVVTETLLSIDRPWVTEATLPQLPWDQVVGLVRAVRASGRPGDGSHPSPSQVLDITSGALPSDLVPLGEEAQAFALDTFAPGQPLAHAVAALSTRIHREFEYHHGSTTGTTTLEEVLRTRQGASQDFAHVMLAALRSLGLAALYVSGYRETSPQGEERLRRVDASHAWVAVWFPGAGWVHIDPTNATFIDDRYVVLGWGRDLRDVSPLRGIAYAEGGGSRLTVGVDLVNLSAADLAARLRVVGAGP